MAGFQLRVPDIVARLRVDSKSGLAEAESDANSGGLKIGKALGGAIVAGGALLGLDKIREGIKSVVDAASNLTEATNKAQVVFGPQAKDIQAWADQAQAIGLSKNQALDALGVYGNLFRAIGLTSGQSAKFSTSLTGLAADLASFNNTSIDDAIEAIRSGMVGETEPLRRFGVNMNQATLQAQAMKLGLIKTTKEALTPAIQAQAAYALIMQQTTLAQGDFKRSAGSSLANQQRELAAGWDNLKTKIGQAFLPAAMRSTQFMAGTLVPALEKVTDRIQPLLTWVANLGHTIATKLQPFLKTAGDFLRKYLLPAFTALGGFLQSKVLPPLERLASTVGNTILSAFRGIGDVLGSTVMPLLQRLGQAFSSTIGPLFTQFSQVVGGQFQHTMSLIGNAVSALLPTIKEMASAFVANFFPVLKSLGGLFTSTVLPVIGQIREGFITNLVPVLKTAGNTLKGLWPVVKRLADVFVKNLGPILKDIGSMFVQLLPVLRDAATVIIGKVVPVVAALVAQFVEKALPVIRTVIDVISQDVFPILKGLAEIIIQHVIPAIVGFIKPIASGLIDGVTGLVKSLMSHLKPALEWLKRIFEENKDKIAKVVDVVGKVAHVIGVVLGGVLRFIGPILGHIAGILGQVLVGAIGLAIKAIGWIVDAISGFWGKITGIWDALKGFGAFIGDAFSSLGKTIGDFFSGLWDGATSKFGELLDWVKSLPQKILDGLGDLGSLLLDVGSNLVHGLWKGISGAWDWFMGKVGDFFGAMLPDWVKDMLGIHSPSRVFAEIGGFVTEGMALGMTNGIKQVRAAAQNLADASIPVMATPAGMGYAAATVAAGGGVTNHYTFNEVLTGSRTENLRQARMLASRTRG